MAAHYKRPDYWAVKAKQEGFPARSVYKLKEINEKFDFFGKGAKLHLLDLGASPGSWSLYASRLLGKGLSLTAVDMVDLAPSCKSELSSLSGEFVFLQGDITDSKVKDSVSMQGPFDIVISDAAPLTTGNSFIDSLHSIALAETALDYASHFLVKGGKFAVKVFQGDGSADLLTLIKELFLRCKSFKPQACRAQSFEIYYLGLGKRGY